MVSSNISSLSSVSVTKKSLNTTLDTATVCAGDPDKHLLDYAKSKKKLISKTGEVAAKVHCSYLFNGKTYLETV